MIPIDTAHLHCGVGSTLETKQRIRRNGASAEALVYIGTAIDRSLLAIYGPSSHRMPEQRLGQNPP